MQNPAVQITANYTIIHIVLGFLGNLVWLLWAGYFCGAEVNEALGIYSTWGLAQVFRNSKTQDSHLQLELHTCPGTDLGKDNTLVTTHMFLEIKLKNETVKESEEVGDSGEEDATWDWGIVLDGISIDGRWTRGL